MNEGSGLPGDKRAILSEAWRMFRITAWLWRHIGSYLPPCRPADFARSFLSHPTPPIALGFWVKSMYAFIEYLRRHPLADKRQVFSVAFDLAEGRPRRHIRPKSILRKLESYAQAVPPCLLDPDNFTDDGHLTTGPDYLR